MTRRAAKKRQAGGFPWKRLGAALIVALPALFFIPGVGFESSHPTSLARNHEPDGTWFYRVQAKDSLTTISEQELGTFTRYKEIVELNPGVKPRALPVGAILRMPAKDRTAQGATSAARKPADRSPIRLLLSFAGLLGLVLLVVSISGRLERRSA